MSLSTTQTTVEEKLRHTVALLDAVARVQSYFILGADTAKLFDELLADLLSLTESEYGFIGEILHKDDGTPYLKTHAITNIAWNDETRTFYKENAPSGLEFVNLKSLFGAAITSEKVVIANDPPNDPRRTGIPDGHPALNAFLGLPVINSGEMIGMMGIANRPGGYDQEMADWLSPLLTTYGNIIQAHRSDRARLLAEERLTEHDAQTKSIVETVLDAIVTIDDKGIIATFNPAAEMTFGYTADEVIGQNVKMLMTSPHREQHDDYLKRYLSTGEAKVIGIGRETTGLRKDGSIFPLDLAVSPMTVNGKRMFTGIVRDISERRKIEKLQSEFVSTVSHELRTPLTSIMGSLGLVRSGVAGKLPTKAQSMLDIAYSNSERLVTLINDILDIEKLASGRMKFDMQAVDLNALAQEAIDANAGYAEKFGIFFELTEKAADAGVRGDSVRLMQVFANLLSNAAKYSPEGDTVSVRIATHENTVHVRVSDNGDGVPEDARGNLFKRFAQGDSSNSRQKGGTGLGLAISKSIADRHLGTIGYDETDTNGGTFWFELPLASGGVISDDVASPHDGVRVLIVEDIPGVAAALGTQLQKNGYDVATANSAAAAKRMLAGGAFNALTLDLVLPDGDGITLFRDIRSAEETRDIPIVVVAARLDDASQSVRSNAISIVDWIDKPIDTIRMMNAVQAVARTSDRPCRLLHVEDDDGVVAVVGELVRDDADVVAVPTMRQAREALATSDFDAVILDLSLPDGAGEELLADIKNQAGAPLPVIVFSAREMDKDTANSIHEVLTAATDGDDTLMATLRSVLPFQQD